MPDLPSDRRKLEDRLKKIHADRPANPSKESSEIQYEAEAQIFEQEAAGGDFDNRSAEEGLRGRVQDRQERKTYATKIFRLVCVWLAAMMVTVGLQGFGLYGFDLDGTVLSILVGSTTASIVAIFAIVVTYLFPKR